MGVGTRNALWIPRNVFARTQITHSCPSLGIVGCYSNHHTDTCGETLKKVHRPSKSIKDAHIQFTKFSRFINAYIAVCGNHTPRTVQGVCSATIISRFCSSEAPAALARSPSKTTRYWRPRILTRSYESRQGGRRSPDRLMH